MLCVFSFISSLRELSQRKGTTDTLHCFSEKNKDFGKWLDKITRVYKSIRFEVLVPGYLIEWEF